MRGKLIARAAAGLVLAVVNVVFFSSAASSDTGDPGTPLTKEQYFDRSIQLMTEVDEAINARYDQLEARAFPPKKCARIARRFNGRLASILAEAQTINPPPEIASINSDLLVRGQQVVNGIDRAARRARHRKFVCGYDIVHPAPNRISRKISLVFERSGFDPTLQKLRDMGYVPSGE
jgi:hypothetical protein